MHDPVKIATEGSNPSASAIWNRKYYAKNATSERKRLKESNERRKKYLANLINSAKSNPCSDCGNSYPTVCMDFDHVNGKKEFSIARAIGDRLSLDRILLEIEKCELVCSNCHRIRTSNRLLRD